MQDHNCSNKTKSESEAFPSLVYEQRLQKAARRSDSSDDLGSATMRLSTARMTEETEAESDSEPRGPDASSRIIDAELLRSTR